MNQKKKLDALNKTLLEITQAIENVKYIEKQNIILDDIMTKFTAMYSIPNFKPIIEDKHSMEGWEANEYYYHGDFGKNAPDRHNLHNKMRYQSVKKREAYLNKYKENKDFMLNMMKNFAEFLENNYTIELASKPKKIIDTSHQAQQFFIIKELGLPLSVYSNLNSPSIGFTLIDKYDSDLVKEFKKSFLVSFYEKKIIESSLQETEPQTAGKRKVQKI